MGIIWNDKTSPLLSIGPRDITKRLMAMKRKINECQLFSINIHINKDRFFNAVKGVECKRFDTIYQFEASMISLQNMCCYSCHSVFFYYSKNRKKYICQLCQNDFKKKVFFIL